MIRKHLAGFAASALALAVSAQAFAGTVSTDGPDLVIKTKGGLEVATTDKAFSFKLGGKLQWDATQFDGLMAADQNKPFDDTFNTFIRRGEISLEGTAYSDWDWGLRLSYDDTDTTEVDRAFIAYTGLDAGTFTIGRFGGDYGLENTTSSSWITAIERPFMYDFLNGDEDTKFGVNFKHSGDNYGLMAQIGHYDTYESADSGNDEAYGYTLRAHWAPYLNGTDVIHLGANYHSSNPDDDRARARTRMGIRSDNDFRLTFGDVRVADKDVEWVLESGAQFGAFRAQAEYFQRQISGENQAGVKSDVDLSGYYAQVSYMFNGVRQYKAADGKWDKPDNMKGSWEIFARYESSTIDADAAAIPGNLGLAGIVAENPNDEFKTKAMVVGVNYFATPAVRMSLNYVDYQVDNINTSALVGGKRVEDDGKAIIGRLQYVF
ncbi:OprO/OprP family phosphate-selective porin [Pseudomonas sp. NCCP-436]|uniref:OprO/OprP family phosphate-selective porin n=1 Tax=Pseudomonas sp. NCCP-436 TaxID=2842481 RepID=UPI001C803775|nr:porin [Pseudomonas sp. NCCP-436]GIZ11514.1 porin O [Pseudomonas sp. NCCP-436]